MDSGPSRRSERSQIVTVGASFAELESRIEVAGVPLYITSAKCFIVALPASLVAAAERTYDPGAQVGVSAGLVAFSQSCPYEGIQLLFCQSAAWFQCLGCGSEFSMFGEKKGGPAPRGMTLMPLDHSGHGIVVQTATMVPGPPIGTDFSHQQAAGPVCF